MNRFAHSAFVAFLLLSSAVGSAQDGAVPGPAEFRGRVQPFVVAHCLDCHGPDIQKSGLRLDKLSTDLSDEVAFSRWVRVHDKLAAGQMPPPDGGPLPKAEAESFTKWLQGQLHSASLAHQQSQGRVPVRRLSGTQYENTIRELVGTQVRVKELLPEEKSIVGFDNVASALDFSAT